MNLIEKRAIEGESSFEISQTLKRILFQEILDLLHNDYTTFASRMAWHLAWDYFCNVSGSGISTDLLRRGQLDIWMQLWEKNMLFPFGKIIDDFFTLEDRKPSNNTRLNGYADMVDAEGLTYAIVGLMHQDGSVEPVSFLTCDPLINVKERIEFSANLIFKFDKNKQRLGNIRPGKVYCLNKENLKIVHVF